ncbi:hypothetical protein BDM02DRAFT_3182547 [Thelephora ganbajun]|uniref:Uncharacterized protein n=1 Tax=Thelephora ganbajun TaxID=370292 RepID=A0ACB6ZVR1_THEGA|nr:hypothetical protein BDM02DRAFT_3182547 [Thelephora ganbajun]
MPATVRSRVPIKKALCVGIEYRELAEHFPQLHLPAVHKDPVIMAGLLQGGLCEEQSAQGNFGLTAVRGISLLEYYGYRPENITILTDAKGTNRPPTRDNIVASMHELVRDAQAGDHLVFHFSGHGSQVLAPPDHVEEVDGWDELIWPCDVRAYLDYEETIQVDNYILDDDIKKFLVDPLPAGVRLAILFDCCSSGTAADLPFSCGASILSSPINPRDISFCRPVQVGAPLLPRPRRRSKTIIDLKYDINALNPKRRTTFQSLDEWPSDNEDPSALPFVTSWAACLDNQATLESSVGSVFLRALKESLKQNPHQTNGQMLNNITSWLHRKVPWRQLEQQPPKPQLSSNLSLGLVYHATFEL